MNQRLVTQNFVKNSLRNAPETKPILIAPPPKCAIPLLGVPMRKDIGGSTVIVPAPKDLGMIVPPLPVCR